MNTVKIGEDQLKLNQGSLLLQTLIGLLFAGGGVFFMVVLATGGLDALDQGARSSAPVAAAPPLLKAGWIGFCGLFVLMGLALAGYRKSVVLDRQSRQLTETES